MILIISFNYLIIYQSNIKVWQIEGMRTGQQEKCNLWKAGSLDMCFNRTETGLHCILWCGQGVYTIHVEKMQRNANTTILAWSRFLTGCYKCYGSVNRFTGCQHMCIYCDPVVTELLLMPEVSSENAFTKNLLQVPF